MRKMEFASLKRRLDLVDQSKECLQKSLGTSDKSFFENLLQYYPQFVIAGAQSAGKSSVIRRISGVCLPEKGTRCTRTAILLKLRREAYVPVVVELKRFDGDGEVFTDPDVTTAIQRAQDKAIKESGGSEFAENHYVEVLVRNPDLPNITLVDLPGFTNDNENDTQIVQRMVQRYLQMPGSLVLQVVKADQDYGAVLGNDFLRPFADKCTTVFTYCDMLDNHPPENVQAWMEKAVQETKLPRFAVLGSFTGTFDEEEKILGNLKCFGGLDHGYQLGTACLNSHLEALITKHLDQQLPITIKSLQDELERTEKRLEAVKERSPIGVVLDAIHIVTSRINMSATERANGMRQLLDKMRVDIQNVGILTIDSDSSSRILEKGEVLEPGTDILVHNGQHGKTNLVKALVLPSSQHNGSGHFAQFEDGTSAYYSNESLSCTADSCKTDVIKEIQVFLKTKCGLRNLAHSDTQLVIDRYAQDFASRCEKVMLSHCVKFKTLLEKHISAQFKEDGDDVPVMSIPVLRNLKTIALSILEQLNAKVVEFVSEIARWNRPPLAFTPNEHYLDDIFRALIANDTTSGSTDEGSATIQYYHVRAYLKVEKKAVVEAASKFFVSHFECRYTEQIVEKMRTESDTLVGFVKEPSGMKRDREILTRRRAGIKQAMDILLQSSLLN